MSNDNDICPLCGSGQVRKVCTVDPSPVIAEIVADGEELDSPVAHRWCCENGHLFYRDVSSLDEGSL